MACYGSGAVRTSMAFLAGVLLAVGVLRRGLVSAPPPHRPLPHTHTGVGSPCLPSLLQAVRGN